MKKGRWENIFAFTCEDCQRVRHSNTCTSHYCEVCGGKEAVSDPIVGKARWSWIFFFHGFEDRLGKELENSEYVPYGIDNYC